MTVQPCPACGHGIAAGTAPVAGGWRCPHCSTAIQVGLSTDVNRSDLAQGHELDMETEEEAAMRLAQDRKWAHDVMQDEARRWRVWRGYVLLGAVSVGLGFGALAVGSVLDLHSGWLSDFAGGVSGLAVVVLAAWALCRKPGL